jgi:hypothetical protein
VRFGSQATRDGSKDGQRRPQTFNFLGFTHFVSQSRRGHFSVRRKTEGKRITKKLKLLNDRVRALRVKGGKAMMAYVHQHLRVHIQYYGVSGNLRSVRKYYYFALKLLFKWLNRRSQRRSMTWVRYGAVMPAWMPRARIVHSLYPRAV